MAWKCKKIKCQGYDDALSFVLNGDEMYPLILEGFRYLFQNNLTFIDIIEINYGSLDILRISLNLEESEETLFKLITWLESQERYEECQEILSLKGTMS